MVTTCSNVGLVGVFVFGILGRHPRICACTIRMPVTNILTIRGLYRMLTDNEGNCTDLHLFAPRACF